MTSRRNGYYRHPVDQLHYPSVSTVQKPPSFLNKWAAKQGAKGFHRYLCSLIGQKDLNKYLISAQAESDAEIYAVDGFETGGDGSRDFGTLIHDAFEEHLRAGQVVEARTDLQWGKLHERAIKTLTDFWDYSGFEAVLIEKEIYDLEDKHAGRLDIAFKASRKALDKIKSYIRGKVAPTEGLKIGDLKTGSLSFQDHKEQLAAYRQSAAKDPEILEPFTGGCVLHLYREDVSNLKLYFASTEDLDEAYEIFKHKLAIWQYHATQWWKQEHFDETPL